MVSAAVSDADTTRILTLGLTSLVVGAVVGLCPTDVQPHRKVPGNIQAKWSAYESRQNAFEEQAAARVHPERDDEEGKVPHARRALDGGQNDVAEQHHGQVYENERSSKLKSVREASLDEERDGA